MGHLNFRADLADAKHTEDEVAERIVARIPGSRLIHTNDDWRYDLLMYIHGRERMIEVKDDLMSYDTNNVALEYKSRGKWSDIAISLAESWVFKYRHRGHETPFFRLVPSKTLKEAWRSGNYRKVVGGDPGSDTRMVLIPVEEFEQWGVAF